MKFKRPNLRLLNPIAFVRAVKGNYADRRARQIEPSEVDVLTGQRERLAAIAARDSRRAEKAKRKARGRAIGQVHGEAMLRGMSVADYAAAQRLADERLGEGK